MARKRNSKRQLSQRPLIPIDWHRVDELLICGCPGSKIAASMGCSADTLYQRCETEKGMTFTAYSAEKRSCGDNILAEHQYKKSLGITAKGDTTLLIWLGKNRLDQRDTPNEIQVSQDTVKNFNAIMNQLNEIQSPALNNDETSNNAETKS